jgi:hypothetical protein
MALSDADNASDNNEWIWLLDKKILHPLFDPRVPVCYWAPRMALIIAVLNVFIYRIEQKGCLQHYSL